MTRMKTEMPWKYSPDEYKRILNRYGCNITKVAKHLKVSKQYASALVQHLGLEIKKTAILKKASKASG